MAAFDILISLSRRFWIAICSFFPFSTRHLHKIEAIQKDAVLFLFLVEEIKKSVAFLHKFIDLFTKQSQFTVYKIKILLFSIANRWDFIIVSIFIQRKCDSGIKFDLNAKYYLHILLLCINVEEECTSKRLRKHWHWNCNIIHIFFENTYANFFDKS